MVLLTDLPLRTRLFARLIGPFVTLATAVIMLRLGEMPQLARAFFASPMAIWFAGAGLLIGGLAIIAVHQYWRRPTAIVISPFGWFLALRGVTLMSLPQARRQAVSASQGAAGLVWALFGALFCGGLWPTFVGWIARPATPSRDVSPRMWRDASNTQG
jgi:hypothetical protein